MQGEQVFITYGQQSNDKLLQYYGFVEGKNPSDVFVVPDLLTALRDLPYLQIEQHSIRAVEEAGLMPSLQQVKPSLSFTQPCAHLLNPQCQITPQNQICYKAQTPLKR